jgi:hypothetical protein
MVNGSDDSKALPYDLRVLAYFATFAAIAALFQSLVLMFIAPRKRAALLWLLATVIGASLVHRLLKELVFNVSFAGALTFVPAGMATAILGGAYEATYALALGLAQGLVLAWMTARKAAPVIWVAGNLLPLPVSNFFAHLYVGPFGRGTTFIESNAISYGAHAAVTGVALLLILRLRRRGREPFAAKAAAALEGQG